MEELALPLPPPPLLLLPFPRIRDTSRTRRDAVWSISARAARSTPRSSRGSPLSPFPFFLFLSEPLLLLIFFFFCSFQRLHARTTAKRSEVWSRAKIDAPAERSGCDCHDEDNEDEEDEDEDEDDDEDGGQGR